MEANDCDGQLCSEASKRAAYWLESKQFFDCKFLVGSGPYQDVLRGNKLILSMASEVFQAMFYGALSENSSDPIHVEDIQPNSFKLLLQYIYTGHMKVNSIDETCSLYYAAKKYMMEHLLGKCGSYLSHQVNVDNVWQLFEFGQFHEDKELMMQCEKVICINTKNVIYEKMETAEINTVIAAFSFDALNVDSELDLIEAAARFVKARTKRTNSSSPTSNNEGDVVNSENDLQEKLGQNKRTIQQQTTGKIQQGGDLAGKSDMESD